MDPEGDLKGDQVQWVPSIDVRYPAASGYSLWGDNGVTPHDIRQGGLGNCWFMAGTAVVAEKPSRLQSVFLNSALSSNGIYGFQLYVLGVPTTLTVDDSVPLKDGSAIYAKVSKDGALWGPLLEKAFAKLNGTYESIAGGQAQNAIQVLTGAPSAVFEHV